MTAGLNSRTRTLGDKCSESRFRSHPFLTRSLLVRRRGTARAAETASFPVTGHTISAPSSGRSHTVSPVSALWK